MQARALIIFVFIIIPILAGLLRGNGIYYYYYYYCCVVLNLNSAIFFLVEREKLELIFFFFFCGVPLVLLDYE